MALDLCIGVTTGEMVLGSIRPAIGSAIYAANEDTGRRLKGRIAKYISPFDEWPDLLSLTTQWRRLDEGGVDDLREWASSVQAPRLAIIDTLATVRPARRNNESALRCRLSRPCRAARLCRHGARARRARASA